MSELFDPEMGRAIMERDREVIESGSGVTYEESATAAGVDTNFPYNQGTLSRFGRREIGLLGICRDITDRKLAEEEIRQSQQKLRIHIEHTPLAVVEWDLEFRVADWNPSAERIFGYSREEAIGQHGSFLVPAQFRQQVDKTWH